MSKKYWATVYVLFFLTAILGIMNFQGCSMTVLTWTWLLFLPLFVLLMYRVHRVRQPWGWDRTELKKIVLALSLTVFMGVESLHVLTINSQLRPGASLVNWNLSSINLVGKDLHGADLSGANLRYALAMEANLREVKLINSDLRNADLRQADLTGADLSGAILTGVAAGADIREVNLTDANLSGVDLTGLSLCGADLTGAKLDGVVLENTDLAGVIGITDDILASVLEISVDELSCVLTQRNIRLETRESIMKSLKDVCLGIGVDEACAYTTDDDFHSILLLDSQGGLHDWSDYFIEKWEPMALRFCELVVFVEKQEAVSIETCPYILGSPITRYQYHMNVRLYFAKTGELFASETFIGEQPHPCPSSAPREQTTIYGERVSFKVLEDWLADLVNLP